MKAGSVRVVVAATTEAIVAIARANFSQRRLATRSGIEVVFFKILGPRFSTILLVMLFSFALLSSRFAIAEQFSIECTWTEPYYLTFDTEARRVVHESPGGTALKGRIKAVSANELRFDLLRVSTRPFDLVWNEGIGKLTWVGVPSDPTRRTSVSDCHRIRLRPILSEYDGIAPY